MTRRSGGSDYGLLEINGDGAETKYRVLMLGSEQWVDRLVKELSERPLTNLETKYGGGGEQR